MRILLTGASGAVGSELASALVAAGHSVVAATRRPTAYDGPGDTVTFDLDDPDSDLAGAMAGTDAAYYLVHGLDRNVWADAVVDPDDGKPFDGLRSTTRGDEQRLRDARLAAHVGEVGERARPEADDPGRTLVRHVSGCRAGTRPRPPRAAIRSCAKAAKASATRDCARPVARASEIARRASIPSIRASASVPAARSDSTAAREMNVAP